MDELEMLYEGVVKASGGEHGYLSKGNLEYLLDTVKDVGERYPKRQAIVKKAHSCCTTSLRYTRW